MTRRTIIQLIDDVDGSTAAETISFAIDGRSYEIDLSEEHAVELRAVMHPWIESARAMRAVPRSSAVSGRAPRVAADQLRAIRRWGRENGHGVKDSGRIPRAVVEAYEAAHSR